MQVKARHVERRRAQSAMSQRCSKTSGGSASTSLHDLKQRIRSGQGLKDGVKQGLRPPAGVPKLMSQSGSRYFGSKDPMTGRKSQPTTQRTAFSSLSELTAKSRGGLIATTQRSDQSNVSRASGRSMSSVGSRHSVSSQLDRLATLYEKSLLTEEEFLEAKAQTLEEAKMQRMSATEQRVKDTNHSETRLVSTQQVPTLRDASRPTTAKSAMSRGLPSDRAKGFGRSRIRKVVPGMTEAPPCNPKANLQLQTGALSHNIWMSMKSSRPPTVADTAPSWGAHCRGVDDGLAPDHPGRWLEQSSAELMNYPNLQRNAMNKINMDAKHGTRIPVKAPSGSNLGSPRDIVNA